MGVAHFTPTKRFSEKVAFFVQICYHYPSTIENPSFACHQKKVLALVLAFACAFTMFAGAAFTDDADIKAADAVDMLTALGVIDGYDDGSFKPDATVTRAEAAKMIFTIRNGGNDNADAFTGGKTTFTDVYAGYWAEGYIKYCQSMGIISGKSTTKFVPEGTVTGTELAKMLLVTLGYDPKTAGLEGAGWDQKTIGLASENGLLDDVTASLSAACPRQYAAQIMYNAINADIVTLKDGKYQKVETTTSKIVPVDVDGDGIPDTAVAQTVTENKTLGKEYMDLNESSAIPMLEMSKNDKGEYSFAVFTKIDKDYSELMGQNVKVLYKDTDDVYGVYADSDSEVAATGVVGDLDTVNGSSDKIKLDGTEYKIDNNAKVYSFNNSTSTGKLADLAASHSGLQQAYSIKLIDNDNNGKVDTALVTPFVVAEVTYVGNTSMTFQSVTGFDTIGNKDVEDIVAYDGIAEDDWAVVYMAGDTVDGNYHAVKASVVTGEVTGTRKNGTEGMIDGNWYTSLVSGETFNVGDKVDVVTVGKYAFDVEISDTSATSADVLYVDGLEIKGGLNAGLNAKLYFTDGTSKEALISKIDGYSVKTTALESGDDKKVYVSDGAQAWADDATGGATNSKKVGTDNLVDKVYTFTMDGSKYEIKSISATNKAGFKGYDTVASYADKTLKLSTNGTAKIADDAVIFVEGDDDTKVIAGSVVNAWGKNTITLTADNSIMMYSESNGFKYAQVGSLRIDSGDIPDASGDTAYGYVTADPYLIKEGSTNYVQYTLWTANGEKTVRVKTSDFAAAKGDFISYNVGDGTTIKDINKSALAAAAVTAYADGKDINMVKADQTAVDAAFANKLADDVTIVYVNTKDTKGVDGGKIRTASKDSNGKYIANVMYKLDTDKKVEVLFVDVNNDLEAVDNPVDAENKANEEAVAAAVNQLKTNTSSAAGTTADPFAKTQGSLSFNDSTADTLTVTGLFNSITGVTTSVELATNVTGHSVASSLAPAVAVSTNDLTIADTDEKNLADGDKVGVKVTFTAGTANKSAYVLITLNA